MFLVNDYPFTIYHLGPLTNGWFPGNFFSFQFYPIANTGGWANRSVSSIYSQVSLGRPKTPPPGIFKVPRVRDHLYYRLVFRCVFNSPERSMSSGALFSERSSLLERFPQSALCFWSALPGALHISRSALPVRSALHL